MSIRFACRCGKKMKASDDMIGKKILCSECGSPVMVPESDTAVVENVGGGSAAADTASELLRAGSRKKSRDSMLEGGFGERIGIDIIETVKYFSMIAIPVIVFFALIIPVGYWLSSMMFTTGSDLPELGYVTGTITLDGQPLEGAMIMFKPASGRESGSNIAASMGRSEADGTYVLTYVRNVEGAAVGRHRVEIQAGDENGRERLPPRYHILSQLTVDVKPGNNPPIDFKLSSEQ